MAQQTPLHYVFYIAAPSDKVWEGFVSPGSNRIIFTGGRTRSRSEVQRFDELVGTGATGSLYP
jgi:hypothetical protein